MTATAPSQTAHPERESPARAFLFAAGPDPEFVAEVSTKLRKAAGLPAKSAGLVANNGDGKGVVDKVKEAVS